MISSSRGASSESVSDESDATLPTTWWLYGLIYLRARNGCTKFYSCASITSTTRCTPLQETLLSSTSTLKILTQRLTTRAFTGTIRQHQKTTSLKTLKGSFSRVLRRIWTRIRQLWSSLNSHLAILPRSQAWKEHSQANLTKPLIHLSLRRIPSSNSIDYP